MSSSKYHMDKMSSSKFDSDITHESGQVILKWVKAFACTLIFCLLAPVIFLFLLGPIFVFREVISFVFKFYYDGKFKLASSLDSATVIDVHANSTTINTVVYVQGQTYIHKLRNLFLRKVILHEKPDGHQTNQRLLWRGVKKLGFFTWEDFSDRFDIREHVRFCPGADQSHRIYSENEVLEALEKLLDDPLTSERPQWELLYVPKVKIDKDGDLHYAIIFRVFHPYMDGLSVIQLLRKLLDSEGKLTLDPVNPPMRKPSLFELIGIYSQVFLLGPYAAFKVATLQKNVLQQTDILKGPKFMGSTKKEITMKSVKQIRDRFNCSTSAVFHSVIAGALRRVAERKGLPIPEEINFGSTVAHFPYPSDEPQNRLTLLVSHSPVSIVDPVLRLSKLNGILKNLAPYEVFTFYYLTKLTGYFPTFMVEEVAKSLIVGYALTNIPGLTQNGFIEGHEVKSMYGCPTISYGLGMGVGIASYAGKLGVCWIAEKTPLISNKDDMDDLVANFEKEFSLLESLAYMKRNHD